MEPLLSQLGARLLSSAPLLLPLVAAHLLADFPLQPAGWVARKQARRAHPVLWLHAGVASLLGYALAGHWPQWWLIPYLWLGHALIDLVKSRRSDSARVFLSDQGLHLLHLLCAAFLLGPGTAPARVLLGEDAWLVAIALLLNWYFAGILLAKCTRRWREELEHGAEEELARAGLWIGRLERVLALAFVLTGQPTAVGLLIAAKSIFRFASREYGGRKESEYFLVGTLGSLAFAILTGMLVAALL